MCGLPKDKWKRRTDWRCCSTKCTNEYSKIVCFVWQDFRMKVFQRDKYECVKCGFKARKELIIPEGYEDYYNKKYIIFKRVKVHASLKVIVGDESKLIADHIIPIAIGGEEYDLENIQSLCNECNKVKTKKDMQKISLYRKQDESQINLLEIKND